jgi:tetratricopeptide (TPR) repeat protein
MSFQGDVAGIGLGELLQGLARGGRDGVLNLFGKDIAARIGLVGGQLFLVSSPEEDPQVWRARSTKAWVHAPNPALDHDRREAIARAERLETVFAMLEAPNLHFRFEQGPLPPPPQGPTRGSVARGTRNEGMTLGNSRGDHGWGPGMSVEFLLLEHARISDEVRTAGGPRANDMPRALDAGRPPQGYEVLIAECDGRSTMVEIADRLGWPLRQCSGVVNELVHHGHVRLATPREILTSALVELEGGQYERVADRLEGWLASTPAGPPSADDGELLGHIWQRGQLATVLSFLKRRAGRSLCKRLDHVATDLTQSIALWTRFVELHGSDGVARLHLSRLGLAASGAAVDAGVLNEMLRQARQLTEAGFSARARALLVALRDREAPNLAVRVDIGHRMLAAGMATDAAEVLTACADELLEEGDLTRARRLVGALLVEVPEYRPARDLLAAIDAREVRKKRRTWQVAVGAAVAVVLSGVGIVHVKSERELERRIAEITGYLDRPAEGLALVEQYYPGEQPARIAGLASALERRRVEAQETALATWNTRCEEIESAIERGDLLVSTQQIVALGTAPELDPALARQLRPRTDLLGLVGGRLTKRFEASDPGVDGDQRAIDDEGRDLEAARSILGACIASRVHSEYRDFVDHVELLVTRWDERRSERAQERERKTARDREARQDRLLGSARFLAASGELEKALESYDELLAIRADDAVVTFVQNERANVATQLESWKKAVEHAAAGRHSEALAVLEAAQLDLSVLPLPWRVTSQPSGASVTLSDGTTHVTPFVMRTPAGRRLELRFELEGTLPVTVTVDGPSDHFVYLHASPERLVPGSNRIDALPVLVGNDMIVADRRGSVRRIGPAGEARWNVDLTTLGGIARTPRFLPARPGWMLVVSEEGKCWLVGIEDGRIEGPWEAGSPPLRGPEDLGGRLALLLNDGRLASWTSAVEPTVTGAASQIYALGDNEDAEYSERYENLVCLRSNTGRDPVMGNPWNAWRVEVQDDMYLVRLRQDLTRSFTVERFGRFSYVAWEKPSALVPEGRLWISDDAGLRSYVP